MIFSETPNLLISQKRKQFLLRAMRYGGQVVSSAAAHPPRPVGPDMPAGHETPPPRRTNTHEPISNSGC